MRLGLSVMKLSWADERTALARAAIGMAARGLVSGASGNASTRLVPPDRPEAEERYLITPAGLAYDQLDEAALVEVDGDLEPVFGDGIPSSESQLHLSIYRARPDVRSVMHTHSIYATVAAVLGRPIPPVVDEMVVMLGGAVEVAEYAFPSTEELAESAEQALGGRAAVLLRNHGLCVAAESPDAALRLSELVERVAQIHLFAVLSGGATTLPADVVAAEQAVYRMRAGLPEAAATAGGE